MTRAIVIAVSEDGAAFAIETEEGRCAVLLQDSEPRLQAGDMLDAAVIDASAPLRREDALSLLEARGRT